MKEKVCVYEREYVHVCVRESVCERESVCVRERMCVRENVCERVCVRACGREIIIEII